MESGAAFELRRRVLEFWRHAAGEETTIRMHESTVCRGTLAAVDSGQSRLHVRQLQTRIGTYPCATVRTGDVLAVEFDSPWILDRPLPPPPCREPPLHPAASGEGEQAERRQLGEQPEAAAAAAGPDPAAVELASRKRALLAQLAGDIGGCVGPPRRPAVPAIPRGCAALRGAEPGAQTGVAAQDEARGVGVDGIVARRPLAGPDSPGAARVSTVSPGPRTGGPGSPGLVSRGPGSPSPGSPGPDSSGPDTLGLGSLVPEELAAWDGRHKDTHKYWRQRYKLFSRFDHGIRLDRDGWFSVTPEAIARQIARRCQCDLIIDAFAGVGGNAIAFARTCCHVVAIDIDETRLRIARHNAGVYGVADRIEFIHGDFLALAPRLQADVVFLSPPWGGPGYKSAKVFDLDSMMGGLDGADILRAALGVAGNVGYYLPKNVGLDRVGELAAEQGVALEVEACVAADGTEKALMAYYGFDEADEEEGAVDGGGEWDGEGEEAEQEGAGGGGGREECAFAMGAAAAPVLRATPVHTRF